jgi:hypothetical protein
VSATSVNCGTASSAARFHHRDVHAALRVGPTVAEHPLREALACAPLSSRSTPTSARMLDRSRPRSRLDRHAGLGDALDQSDHAIVKPRSRDDVWDQPGAQARDLVLSRACASEALELQAILS